MLTVEQEKPPLFKRLNVTMELYDGTITTVAVHCAPTRLLSVATRGDSPYLSFVMSMAGAIYDKKRVADAFSEDLAGMNAQAMADAYLTSALNCKFEDTKD
jgi:hypothetical protein